MRTNGIVIFKLVLCDPMNLLQIIKRIGILNIFMEGAIELFARRSPVLPP